MGSIGRTTLALLATLAIVLISGCSKEPRGETPNYPTAPIVLISIDTLRADHLPAYGYAGVKTPNIDALAAESTVFENAYSQVPLTLPSHVSILTGQLPATHGVRNNLGYIYDPAKHRPVTAALKAAGYETGAAISAYVLRGGTGLAGAFDFYDDQIESESGAALGQLQRPGDRTLEVAKVWLSPRTERPFFFMLHLFEPHAPYAPPEPFRSRYAAQPYDGEIAAADEIVGRFVAFLKEKGVYDRAIVILLSDHGEGLGDHGEDEHGIFLYREALHVPLMVKLPKGEQRGERVTEPVQLADLAATILRLVGAPPEAAMTGISLYDRESLKKPRRIFSETLYPRLHLGWSDLRSLIDSRFHYIEAPSPELFDHTRDPREAVNILSDERRAYASLRKEMEAIPEEISVMGAVSAEEAAKLAALGYLGSTASYEGNLPDPKEHIGEIGLLKQAAWSAAQGRVNDAIAIYRRVLETNPRLADGWSLLAAALEQAGRNDEAVEAYRQKLKLSPTSGDEVGLSLGNLLLRMNRLAEAEEHALLAMEKNPAGAHQLLARIAIARHDWPKAEAEARAAMLDGTAKLRATVLLAQIRVKQERLLEALTLLDEASASAKAGGQRVEQLDYTRGDILANLGRNDEAELAFHSEIENFPHDLQAYSNLAVLYFVSGKPERVRPTLDTMFERNPNARACSVAASTLDAIGDKRGAALWKERAKTLR